MTRPPRDAPMVARPRCVRVLLALLAVLFTGGLAVLATPPAPAQAHASLVATEPRQKSVLGYSPNVITMTFSEPVSLVPGRIQVFAPDGKRISDEEPTVEGGTLRIPVRVADRPLGTYLVSYRVISADSHPVAGGFTFSVGAPSATVPEPPQDAVHPSVRVAVPVAKYLGYVGLVLTIGPALLLGLLWPGALSRRGPTRLVRTGLALIAVATVAAAWLQAPYRSGAALTDVSFTEIRQVLGTGFGAVLGVRLAILGAVAVLLPPVLRGRAERNQGGAGRRHGRAGRLRVGLLAALGLAGLTTWPLLGHAVAAPVPAASLTADVIHLLAMSVWLGGLVTLLVFLLRSAHPRVLDRILPVWSRWATVAVVWLVLGGTLQAVSEISAPGQLIGTGYGRLILLKVTLLGAALGAAAYARRLVRRRLAAQGPHRRWLRRGVAFELAATVVVLGLSAVLVQTTPARNADIEAAVERIDSFAQTLTSSLYTLQFDIYPVQLGESNTVHAYVYTPNGERLPVAEWKLTAALPERGVEPVTTPLLGLQPHHAVGAVAFPIPGEWELRFTIRVSEIDQASVTTRVEVR